MNKSILPKPTEKFTVSSESVLVVLGMVALFQIILCFSATFQLVGDPHLGSPVPHSSLETNVLLVRSGASAE